MDLARKITADDAMQTKKPAHCAGFFCFGSLFAAALAALGLRRLFLGEADFVGGQRKIGFVWPDLVFSGHFSLCE